MIRIGLLRDPIAWLSNPYEYLDRRSAAEGLTFPLSLPGLGRILVTGDPSLIREITTHPDLESGRGIRALRSVFGAPSLIMLDGDSHATRRTCIAPHFQHRQIEYLDKCIVDATRHAFKAVPLGKQFSLYHTVLDISLNLIIRHIFGPLPEKQTRELSRATSNFLNSFSSPLPLFIPFLRVNAGR